MRFGGEVGGDWETVQARKTSHLTERYRAWYFDCIPQLRRNSKPEIKPAANQAHCAKINVCRFLNAVIILPLKQGLGRSWMSQQAENIKVPILLSISICCSLSLCSAGRILWAVFFLPLLSLFRQWWRIWKLWRRNPSMCAYLRSWTRLSVCASRASARLPAWLCHNLWCVFGRVRLYFWLRRDVRRMVKSPAVMDWGQNGSLHSPEGGFLVSALWRGTALSAACLFVFPAGFSTLCSSERRCLKRDYMYNA